MFDEIMEHIPNKEWNDKRKELKNQLKTIELKYIDWFSSEENNLGEIMEHIEGGLSNLHYWFRIDNRSTMPENIKAECLEIMKNI